MIQVMKKIILASKSPRRRQLMEMTGLPFDVIVSEAPEDTDKTHPGEIVMDLSFHKAAAVAEKINKSEECLIIGADTIVWLDGRALGKPADRQEARQMIKALQGREHSVFTGVSILDGRRTASRFYCETKVRVHEMSPQEIEDYLDTGEAYDKAGAYGIQGAFGLYVDSIEGDYNNVVGLPVAALYQELKKLPPDPVYIIEHELADLPILQYGLPDVGKIRFTDRVRHVCETECPQYNTSWSCPPAVGSVSECEQRCRKFRHCFVFSTVAEVNDTARMEETLPTRMVHEEITAKAADAFKQHYGEVLVLSTESCELCPECSWPASPCIHPDRMFPCVESYGILVTDLAEQCGMEYQNGLNAVTWFSVIFYGKN